ncbi:MAG: hypothetical protein IJ859_11880 [Synergistaceae bacterium]|nr:hypothetical protein [Synergistaceae bacterium]
MSNLTVSTVKSCISEAISVLNDIQKSESQTFYKNLLRSTINTLSNAIHQCESYEKAKNFNDEVFIIENGVVRKAKKEEIFKLVRRLEDIL